jgi:type I restriction enzyme S subunit
MHRFLRLRKSFFEIDDAEEYQLVTVQLHARGIRERRRLTGAQIKTKRQQRIRGGDLLVAEIDAKGGGFGIVPDELTGAIVSSHYFLYELDTAQVDRLYLEYYLKSGYPEQEVGQFVKGSVNYAAIRPHHFPQLHMPLPPLDEQRRVGARIEALATRIREAAGLQNSAREEAEALLRATHLSSFPARLAELPDWRRAPFGELCQNLDAKRIPVKSADRASIRGEYPYYGASGIIDYVSDYLFDGEHLLISEDGANLRLRHLPIAFLATGRFWVNNHAHVVQAKPSTSNAYLAYALEACDISGLITGTAQPKLTQTSLNSIPIPVPESIQAQEQIVRRLDGLNTAILLLQTAQESTKAMLGVLMPSVLDKAFRGDL